FRVLHLERLPLAMAYSDQLDLVASRCLEVFERVQELPLLPVDASGNGRAPAETLTEMSRAGDPFEVVRVSIVAGDGLGWHGSGQLSLGRSCCHQRMCWCHRQ